MLPPARLPWGTTQPPGLSAGRCRWICGSPQPKTSFFSGNLPQKARCKPPRPSPGSDPAPPRLTQSEVGDDTGEDEGGEEGEGEDEGVEVAIVALPHAVAHPGAVVVEPLWNKRDTVRVPDTSRPITGRNEPPKTRGYTWSFHSPPPDQNLSARTCPAACSHALFLSSKAKPGINISLVTGDIDHY